MQQLSQRRSSILLWHTIPPAPGSQDSVDWEEWASVYAGYAPNRYPECKQSKVSTVSTVWWLCLLQAVTARVAGEAISRLGFVPGILSTKGRYAVCSTVKRRKDCSSVEGRRNSLNVNGTKPKPPSSWAWTGIHGVHLFSLRHRSRCRHTSEGDTRHCIVMMCYDRKPASFDLFKV